MRKNQAMTSFEWRCMVPWTGWSRSTSAFRQPGVPRGPPRACGPEAALPRARCAVRARCSVRPGFTVVPQITTCRSPATADDRDRARFRLAVRRWSPTGTIAPEVRSAALRAAHRPAAPGSSRSAPARRRWPRPACWTSRPAASHWAWAEPICAGCIRRSTGISRCCSWTTATSSPRPGSAPAIDLCLHVVRSDHGSAVANRAARRCVMPAWRDGGQAQYIERPVPAVGRERARRRPGPGRWTRLDEPVSLEEMAGHARMSVRTFTRRFRDETGLSPRAAGWLRQRVAHAQAAAGVDRPGRSRRGGPARPGLGSATALRQHLQADDRGGTDGVPPDVPAPRAICHTSVGPISGRLALSLQGVSMTEWTRVRPPHRRRGCHGSDLPSVARCAEADRCRSAQAVDHAAEDEAQRSGRSVRAVLINDQVVTEEQLTTAAASRLRHQTRWTWSASTRTRPHSSGSR